MRFFVLLSFLLVTSGVEGDEQCSPGEECLPEKDCSGYQKERAKLNERTKGSPAYDEQLNLLRGMVCNGDERKVCCPAPDSPSYRPSLEKEECGLGYDPSGFIWGGEDTWIGEFPFMALLGLNVTKDGYRFVCGGTLINKWYVLSAAHCLDDYVVDYVRLGEWKVVEEDEPTVDCDKDKRTGRETCAEPHQDIPVAEIKLHPDYSEFQEGRRLPLNDIMLLKLSRPAEYNDFVQPVCLPSSSMAAYGEPDTPRFDNNRARAVGWGKTRSEKDGTVAGIATPLLQKVEMPALGNSDCIASFQSFKVNLTNIIKPDYHLCAGGERGKDSCRGDSGGPLLGRQDDLSPWQVVGVTSAGAKKCGFGIPALFTRVTQFEEWIQENLV